MICIWMLIWTLTDLIGLTYCQNARDINCTVDLTIEPSPVTIGKSRELKVICKSSLNLRLILDQNPFMYIQKYTPRGLITVASLDGNDTVTIFEKGIKVIGFFPTNFKVIYTKPSCYDVTSYRCSVNVSNTRRCSLKASASTQGLGKNGPPRLTISPEREIYKPGKVISLTCSSSFFNVRKVFSWNWSHPEGKLFPEGRVQGQVRAGKACNRTSKVTLTLAPDDNGAIVVCMTQSNGVTTLVLRVAEEATTTTAVVATSMFDVNAPVDCVPAYSLALVAILMVIFTLTIYTVILIAGGSQLRLPFRKCIIRKDRSYAVPDRAAAIAEDENRYYSLKRNQDYMNSDYVNRTYEDIEN